MLNDAQVNRLQPEFVRLSRICSHGLGVSPEYFEAEMWMVAIEHEQDWSKTPAQIASCIARYTKTVVLRFLKKDLRELSMDPVDLPEPCAPDTSLLKLVERWAEEFALDLDTAIDILARGESEVTSRLAKELLAMSPKDLYCAVFILSCQKRREWEARKHPRRQYDKTYRRIKNLLRAG